MKFTFKGGLHIPESKNTSGCAIRRMPAPDILNVPLSQHIGAPGQPSVKKGDKVARGQKIGDVTGGLGCPVHSAISGKVIDIVEKVNNFGTKTTNIVIENDHEDRTVNEFQPFEGDFTDIDTDKAIERIREAGISGMGGATFPTYAKISSALGKVDKLIINCAECEPYITANHRLLLEEPDVVIGGMKILLCILKLRHGDIAIEDNKHDAIKLIKEKTSGSDLISVKVLKTKYPQGDERQLIYALYKREIPAGKLPADVKCVVFNAETCAAVYRAFVDGIPLIERVVTIDGDCVKEPSNVLAPIGVSYQDIIDFCGGVTKPIKRIINGGPMMGAGQWDMTYSVSKGTSALLVFSDDDDISDLGGQCIRCGRCVSGCQMHLEPVYLALFARNGKYDLCEKYGVRSCVECGLCSYVCRGGVPITQLNRKAKARLREKQMAARAAKNK